MSLDSDRDLQAYINQLSKKTQDWQHGKTTSSDSISTPTHISSYSSIKEKKVVSENVQSVNKKGKLDKIKQLESKYLKKQAEQNCQKEDVSLSQTESNDARLVLEQHPSSPLRYEEPSYDSEGSMSSYSEQVQSFKEVETFNQALGSSNRALIEGSQSKIGSSKFSKLLSNDSDENELNVVAEHSSNTKLDENDKQKSVQFQNQRKSSASSLLINKESIFYSTTASTKAKSHPEEVSSPAIKYYKPSSRSSDDITQSDVWESVAEEISDDISMQPKNMGKTSTEFQNTVTRNTSASGAGDRKKKEDTVDKKTDRPLKVSLKPVSSQKKKTSKSKVEMNKKISVPSPEMISSDFDEVYNGRLNKNDSYKKTNSNKKLRKKSKRYRRHRESSSSSSTSVSSSISSILVNIKHKIHKKEQKLQKERELTDLIIKSVFKNLPSLRESVVNPRSDRETRLNLPQHFICEKCGGNGVSWKDTNNRIDDALKQTIKLTRQFLETHQQYVEAHSSHFNENFKYTTLRKHDSKT